MVGHYFIIISDKRIFTRWNEQAYPRSRLIHMKRQRKFVMIFKVLPNLPQSYRVRLTSVDNLIFKLLKMLTPLEPLKRHQDVKLSHTQNTGTWLLSLESFSAWRDSDNLEENRRVICCYGIPGAGKTVIWY